jgi:hypothetical protein
MQRETWKKALNVKPRLYTKLIAYLASKDARPENLFQTLIAYSSETRAARAILTPDLENLL